MLGCRAFQLILDRMAHSQLKAIKRLRRTLKKWKNEILNYFKTRITNAQTEGFNNVAKVIKRRSYGFRNFNHYRLRRVEPLNLTDRVLNGSGGLFRYQM